MKDMKVLLREFRLDAPAPGDSSHTLTLPEQEARELLAQLRAILEPPKTKAPKKEITVREYAWLGSDEKMWHDISPTATSGWTPTGRSHTWEEET